MPNVTERFFTVWCPQSTQPVKRKFNSVGQAIHVRDALKTRFPEREFHILGNVPEDIVTALIAEHIEDTESH